MEEEKAAAYYDELARKGSGAARFKQGLGFSGSSSTTFDNTVPARGSALPSLSSSFLSSFVRASSPSKASEIEKQAQIESIQNKLKKKPNSSSEIQSARVSSDRIRDRNRDRDRGRDVDRDRHSRRRSRSRDDHRRSRHRQWDRSSSRDRDRGRYQERERDRETDREARRRRRRSVSRSISDGERGRGSWGSRDRSRSLSPRDSISEKTKGDGGKARKGRNGGDSDYAKSIEGYDKMTPAERVKAKMKLQLADAAEKDASKGMGSGWERFQFDKDAPLDDDEIEVAEDDAELVKHIGQSFRFSTVEAKREEDIKAAHDAAMFGVSACPPSASTDDELEDKEKENTEDVPLTSLLSNQVLAMQQGSWRDRARNL